MNSLGDWILAITFFFFWLMVLWIFVVLPGRVPARRPGRRAEGRVDPLHAGPAVPWLPGLHHHAPEGHRDRRGLAMAQAASKVSTTDELQKLADLKAAGVVNRGVREPEGEDRLRPDPAPRIEAGSASGAGFFVAGPIRTRGGAVGSASSPWAAPRPARGPGTARAGPARPRARPPRPEDAQTLP